MRLYRRRYKFVIEWLQLSTTNNYEKNSSPNIILFIEMFLM